MQNPKNGDKRMVEETRLAVFADGYWDSLLDANGIIKLHPASFYDALPWEALRLWCHFQARYVVVTTELIGWLREKIAGRHAIEIGSGCGDLAHHLGIPGTDSKVQERDPDVRRYYDLIGQPRCRYPDWVEEAEALEAVRRHRPQVVVASWITHWIDPNGPVVPGSSYGVREDLLLEAVEEYVMIGNLHVHRDKPLLPRAEVIELPGLRSRASTPELDRILVWRRENVEE